MDLNLLPCGGINYVADDTTLNKNDRALTYVRDAVNVDIDSNGTIAVRQGEVAVSDKPYRYLWQSPLHGDVFGLLYGDWVKVDTDTWDSEVLRYNVGDAPLHHAVLNNRVVVAAKYRIYSYDGQVAQPLAIDMPPAPLVSNIGGTLPSGEYQFALSWLRGGMESALSQTAFVSVGESGGVRLTLPLPLDSSIDGVRIYMSYDKGMDLQLFATLPIDETQFDITQNVSNLGRVSAFKNLSPMPTGKYLQYWQGRLWQAQANIIRFSEAMAYHLHDERHGFIQMPQGITFLEAVDGGLWVGQRDHVVFLQGVSPSEFVLIKKAEQYPVQGSAIQMPVDSSADTNGAKMVVWLSNHGYMAGMADGTLLPYQATNLKGIAATAGSSVRFNRRVVTTVN